MPAPRRVVVANPGPQQHLRETASAFAETGELDRYISTLGLGVSEVERIRRRWPHAIAARAASELERRAVDDQVAARATRVASSLELANVALFRSPLPKALKLAGHRPARTAFDRRAAALLEPGLDAVVGSQGTAALTFRRARELRAATVLDYPIAHYAFAESVLQEEAKLVPEYASTIRITRFPGWVRRRYEEEIATADRIIMVSRHHQRNFADAGVDPERTFLVHWFVDCDLFTPADADDDGTFRVAFLGELSQRKGLSYLIEGFQLAALDDAELFLIGSPPGPRPWLGTPGVRHVPPMPRSRLPQTLRRCHAIALPSLVEGFPIAVLEGMACGLPAIVSEHIGDDIVEDRREGWVVPIRDPEAIAERLRTLHADTALRRRMSLAARAKAQTFTRARNHEELRAGVEELLASRGGRR